MKRRRKYWFWRRKGKKMCLLCCYGKIPVLHNTKGCVKYLKYIVDSLTSSNLPQI